MKKYLLIIAVLFTLKSFSQTVLTVKFNKIATTSSNTCKLDSIKNIRFIKQNDDYFVGVFLDTNDNALESFTIVQPNKALFYDKFKNALKSLCDDTSNIRREVDTFIKADPDLYTQFLEAKENLANTNGLAGILTVYKTIKVHIREVDTLTKREKDSLAIIKKNGVKQPKSRYHEDGDTVYRRKLKVLYNVKKFTTYKIQIQFQDGFIENIKVFGKIEGNNDLLRFENSYPIGFSTKKDFRTLIDKLLFEKSDYRKYYLYCLKVGEIISYNQELTNDNKDYSPANQVLTLKSITANKEIPLYKEQTSKILEAKIFSDLKGADNNNPNGLIQIELSKRLNFFSKRWETTSKIFPWKWRANKMTDNLYNYGFFNYVTPQFSLNKVEENQKRLVLNHIDTLSFAADTSKPVTYTSTINLLKHQIYNVGLDLSIFLWDFPVLKSTFNMGLGFHFGRTAIQDTLRTRIVIDSTHFQFRAADTNNIIEYGINTFQWGPYVTWQIFPDSRFGISATQRLTYFQSLSDNFVQVRDSAHYLNFIAKTPKQQLATTPYSYSDITSNRLFSSIFTKCIASSEIYAYFSPNNDGSNKLFFRYRLNWDLANPKKNFQQMQVGFSTYLSSTKEFTNLKKAANID